MKTLNAFMAFICITATVLAAILSWALIYLRPAL
jgi:hypothetical protein